MREEKLIKKDGDHTNSFGGTGSPKSHSILLISFQHRGNLCSQITLYVFLYCFFI